MAMLKPTGLLLATLASASASAAGAVSGLPVGAIGRGGYPRAIEMARGERLLCTGEGGGLRVAAGQLACMLHVQHHSRVLSDWLKRATSSPLVRSCMYGARYQVTGLASLFWPARLASSWPASTATQRKLLASSWPALGQSFGQPPRLPVCSPTHVTLHVTVCAHTHALPSNVSATHPSTHAPQLRRRPTQRRRRGSHVDQWWRTKGRV